MIKKWAVEKATPGLCEGMKQDGINQWKWMVWRDETGRIIHYHPLKFLVYSFGDFWTVHFHSRNFLSVHYRPAPFSFAQMTVSFGHFWKNRCFSRDRLFKGPSTLDLTLFKISDRFLECTQVKYQRRTIKRPIGIRGKRKHHCKGIMHARPGSICKKIISKTKFLT